MLDSWAVIVEKDNSRLSDALAFYETELVEAKKEIDLKQVPRNLLIEAQLSIASNFDKRHTQWAEINYIYNYFDTRLKKTRGMLAVKIYEKCGRAISSTDMKYFLDSNDEVVDLTDKLNKIDLIRNKYLGIKEGFEKMQWRIGDIQKLITAGLEFTLIPVS